MADIVNMSEIAGSLNKSLLDAISPLVTIFKIVGIALLVYIIFLILRAFFKWKSAVNISKISKDVEEINKKMSLLIEKINDLNKKTVEKESKQEKNDKKSFFSRIFGKCKKKKSKKEENQKKEDNPEKDKEKKEIKSIKEEKK